MSHSPVGQTSVRILTQISIYGASRYQASQFAKCTCIWTGLLKLYFTLRDLLPDHFLAMMQLFFNYMMRYTRELMWVKMRAGPVLMIMVIDQCVLHSAVSCFFVGGLQRLVSLCRLVLNAISDRWIANLLLRLSFIEQQVGTSLSSCILLFRSLRTNMMTSLVFPDNSLLATIRRISMYVWTLALEYRVCVADVYTKTIATDLCFSEFLPCAPLLMFCHVVPVANFFQQHSQALTYVKEEAVNLSGITNLDNNGLLIAINQYVEPMLKAAQ